MHDFKNRVHDEVAFQNFLAAVREKRPYSLVRFGDGEAMFLGSPEFLSYSAERQILWTWFGEQKIERNQLDKLKAEAITAFRNSDAIGCPGFESFGIFAQTNKILRRLVLQFVDNRPICSLGFPIYLYRENRLVELFKIIDEVNIITGRDVKAFIEEKFNVRVGNFIRVPPEAGWTTYEIDRHYPDFFENNRKLLSNIKPGSVYLVGAGICGKVYCDWIKKGGGIAIDVGSIFDIWAGKITRAYMDNESSYQNLLLQMKYRQSSAEAHFDLARHLSVRGKADLALEHLDKSISLDASYWQSFIQKAKLYTEIGQLESALVAINKAFACERPSIEMYLVRAGLYSSLGQKDTASVDYNTAKELISNNIKDGKFCSGDIFLYAEILEKSGSIDEALEAYCNAADEDFDNPYAHFHVGMVLQKYGYSSEAASKVRMAIHLSEPVADFHHHLGSILLSLRKFDEAADQQREALRINPNMATAHFLLAEALIGLGDLDAGERACEEAVQLDPQNAYFRHTLREIREKRRDGAQAD